MKLTEIHNNFKTDKGTAHSYLDFYDEIFLNRRLDRLNVLEIGFLFGGSLKMWEYYFENSIIYGIDDFSHKDGQAYHGHEPVNSNLILEDLSKYKRIRAMTFNCENKEEIDGNLSGLRFDIIIDDAKHTLAQQKINFTNYYPYLNGGGIYICEDVHSRSKAKMLKRHMNTLCEREVKILNFTKQSDDRLVALV